MKTQESDGASGRDSVYIDSRLTPVRVIALEITLLTRFVFSPVRAYIKRLRTAVYRLLAKHTSGRKPTFSLEPFGVAAIRQ